MKHENLTDIERYWLDKPFKKWVVYVSKVRGRKIVNTDKVHVGASSYEKACVTGRNNSMLTGKVVVQARLAGPADLCCMHSM